MTPDPAHSLDARLPKSANPAHGALQKQKDGSGARHPKAADRGPAQPGADAPFDQRLDLEWTKWGTG